ARAAGADHLVIEEVGGHADQSQVAAPMADDLVPGRERDEVSEPLQGDDVTVPDQLGDRDGQRSERGHGADVPTTFKRGLMATRLARSNPSTGGGRRISPEPVVEHLDDIRSMIV